MNKVTLRDKFLDAIKDNNTQCKWSTSQRDGFLKTLQYCLVRLKTSLLVKFTDVGDCGFPDEYITHQWQVSFLKLPLKTRDCVLNFLKEEGLYVVSSGDEIDKYNIYLEKPNVQTRITKALETLSFSMETIMNTIQDIVKEKGGVVQYKAYNDGENIYSIEGFNFDDEMEEYEDYFIYNHKGEQIGVLEDNSADKLYDILLGVSLMLAKDKD